MKMKLTELALELRSAGASPAEAKKLIPIAARLYKLAPQLRGEDQTAPQPAFRRYLAFWATATLLVLFTGLAIAAISQSALPGSRLYPIEHTLDTLAVAIHPAYRKTVMMKRAHQINTLALSGSPSQIMLPVVADYRNLAATYQKTPHANYAALIYCKAELAKAAHRSPPVVRQAITSSIDAIDAT